MKQQEYETRATENRQSWEKIPQQQQQISFWLKRHKWQGSIIDVCVSSRYIIFFAAIFIFG